jgi:MOSC domain-containing protein YiiM
MAQVIGIAIRDAKRSPMRELSSVVVTKENGLSGDSRGRGGFFRKGQVTLLSAEQWEPACKELGLSLPWITRRANIYIQGLSFGPIDVGKKLLIGTAELEITGETDPCKRMDEAQPGLKSALTPDWRGGVRCRVIKDGVITLGSTVQFV